MHCRSIAVFFVTFLSLFVSAAHAEPAARWSEVDPQTLQLDIRSDITGRDYRVLVQPPSGDAPKQGYPSLWMMDGHATFPLVKGKKGSDGALPAGVIVAVGFPSGERFDVPGRSEAYTPVPDADTGGPRSGPIFGGADAFRRFLVEELRVVIGARFALDPTRNTLFGFSYGGLFTVEALLKSPGDFQQYWASSPSIWFSEAQILRRLRSGERVALSAGVRPPALTITAGMEEQFPTRELPPDRLAHLKRRAMVDNTREVAERLQAQGLPVTLIHLDKHDHYDMLDHDGGRILDWAFAKR